MKLNYLRSKMKRKYRITTNSNHTFSISKNHLNRAFTPTTLNEVWVSDITYVRTAQG
jgi:putative transposase